MAFHSRKDFCELTGIKSGDFGIYVKRGKLIFKNDLVDDKDPVNVAFIQSRVEKAKPEKVQKVKVVKEATPEQEERDDRSGDSYADELKRKVVFDIEGKKNMIELQRIEIQKKRGEIVPTEAMVNLLTLHTESIKTAFVDASDNLLIVLSQKFQMSAVDMSDIRNQQIAIVNKAIDQAVDSSKRLLKGIVKEYSVKRGVGQHD